MQKNIKQGLYCIIEEPFECGENVYIGNYIHIRPGVAVGSNSEIRDYCFLAGNISIGFNTRIFQYANIGFGTVIGNNCFIGLGVCTLNDKKLCYPVKGNWKPEPPTIGNNVRIGARTIIMPGVKIANGTRIGSGAIVTKDTVKGKTYTGIPARAIKGV
jgi:acetyltransferase-like isoleucine patch superfamily enzyme